MSDNDRERHTKALPDSDSPTLGDLPQHHALEASMASSDSLSSVTSEKIDLPRNLGRYRNLVKIAEGGMSVVYQAFDARHRRKVALKFLHATQTATLRRFLREAASQAKVQHDSVLKVFDIGQVQGLPFIAFDLVEGPSLLSWSRDASVRERVDVGFRAALALQAAHEVGLVHRDVKPSNILLEENVGGSVNPLLTDFGIALDSSDPLLTASLQVIGTPHYMAPEQLTMRPSDLDGRVDVYALGVTLFRMLTGRLPLTGESSAEVMTAILHERPPDLRKVRPGLPEDIEAIVSRCLEKDRSFRYPTMKELADDLQRFLEGQAVKARLMTLGDRARKWIGQNPQTFLATAIGGLIILIALSGWGYSASQQAKRIQSEAARARAEAEEARGTLVFFENLFTRTEPERLRNQSLSATEILFRGVQQAKDELAEEPGSQGRLLMSLGRIYYHLGQYDEAIEIFQEALETFHQLSPSISFQSMEARKWLGNTRIASDDYMEGVRDLRERLAQSRILNGNLHAETARALVDLSKAVGRLKDPQQPVYLEEALAIQDQVLPKDHADRGTALRAYGNWLRIVPDRHLEAGHYLEEALRIGRKTYGIEHRETLETLFILAAYYAEVGREEEAQIAYGELLSVGEATLGNGHPKLGSAWWNYAILLDQIGELEEAETLYKKSAQLEETFPGRPLVKAINQSGLGDIARKQGRYVEAESRLRRALAIAYGIEGNQHLFEIGFFSCSLASVLTDQGRLEEAIRHYETAEHYLKGFGGFVEDRRRACEAEKAEVITILGIVPENLLDSDPSNSTVGQELGRESD